MTREQIAAALREQATTGNDKGRPVTICPTFGQVGNAPWGKAANDTSSREWGSFRRALRADVRRIEKQLPIVMESTGLPECEAIGLVA